MAIDFSSTDAGRAILDAPPSESISKDALTALVAEQAPLLEAEQKEVFVRALRPHIDAIPDDTDILSLAIAVFPCRRCSASGESRFYRYPEVCSHPHFHPLEANFLYSDNAERDVYNRTAVKAFSRTTWPPGSTQYGPFKVDIALNDSALSNIVTALYHIIDALGLDPKRATARELDNCKHRLRCDGCVAWQKDLNMSVYTWDGAVCPSSTLEPEYSRANYSACGE